MYACACVTTLQNYSTDWADTWIQAIIYLDNLRDQVHLKNTETDVGETMGRS